MRTIDWNDKLSDDDIVWLRQTGIPGIEDRIANHQMQYGEEVPEADVPPDVVTRSVLDPTVGADASTGQNNGPQLVDPTKADPPAESDEPDDDYDTWSKAELESEVAARNDLANKSDGTVSGVEVVGTGSKGHVTMPDLVKGLRLWDRENPEVLS